MATKLTRGKPLVRETGVLIDGAPLMVSITEGYVEMWPKGNRDLAQRYEMPWKRIHSTAVSLGLRPARRVAR